MRWMLSVGVLGLLTSAAPALGQVLDEREALRGVQGFRVVVVDVHADAERDGLTTDAIRTAVELRLRRNRLPLTDRTGTPALYVAVGSVKSRYTHAYCLTVKFRQLVSLLGLSFVTKPPPGPLVAVTWARAEIGSVGEDRIRNLIESIEPFIDEFSNDFLAVNPIP